MSKNYIQQEEFDDRDFFTFIFLEKIIKLERIFVSVLF
jgi:hypothetical protein